LSVYSYQLWGKGEGEGIVARSLPHSFHSGQALSVAWGLAMIGRKGWVGDSLRKINLTFMDSLWFLYNRL
jgi:hypothetical protein